MAWKFIEKKSAETELKNQLHAIWYLTLSLYSTGWPDFLYSCGQSKPTFLILREWLVEIFWFYRIMLAQWKGVDLAFFCIFPELFWGMAKFLGKKFQKFCTWSLCILMSDWMSPIFLPFLSLYLFQSLHGLLWDTSMTLLFPYNPCCSPACYPMETCKKTDELISGIKFNLDPQFRSQTGYKVLTYVQNVRLSYSLDLSPRNGQHVSLPEGQKISVSVAQSIRYF